MGYGGRRARVSRRAAYKYRVVSSGAAFVSLDSEALLLGMYQYVSDAVHRRTLYISI